MWSLCYVLAKIDQSLVNNQINTLKYPLVQNGFCFIFLKYQSLFLKLDKIFHAIYLILNHYYVFIKMIDFYCKNSKAIIDKFNFFQ